MAHDKVKIHKEALKVAAKKGVYFIEDVIAFLPISKPTFYDYFKVDSNEFNAIRDLLDTNKIQTKVDIREKLAAGSKAPELTALYKLLATDDERKKLSSQYIDHTTKGKEIKSAPSIDYTKLSTETLKDIENNTKTEDDAQDIQE